jgi:hypothetical protein
MAVSCPKRSAEKTLDVSAESIGRGDTAATTITLYSILQTMVCSKA